MGKRVWLWIGGAILVLLFFVAAFSDYSSTGFAIATNNSSDLTPPTLYITSSYVDSYNVVKIYGVAYDAESKVNNIQIAGPIEYTGLQRASLYCYLNNCSFFLNFSFNPSIDVYGDTYRVYAGSNGGTASKDIVLKFSGECIPDPIGVTCAGFECGTRINNCGQNVNCGTCPNGETCSAGQCVSNLYNRSYSTELISATDLSAMLKVRDNINGINNTGEISEGSSNYILGLLINVMDADETPTSESAKIRYKALNLSTGGFFPQFSPSIEFKFVNSIHGLDYVVELVSATDTSALIKITSGSGTGEMANLLEGEAKIITGLTVRLNSADETTSYGFANLDVEAFTLEISSNQACTDECVQVGLLMCYEDTGYLQTCGNYDSDSCLEWGAGTYCPYGCDIYGCKSQQSFCVDSDKNAQYPDGKNYYALGTVTTQLGNFTDYCNTTGTTWLNEYYCSGNTSAISGYNCPYGCNAGVCKQAPKQIKRCKGLQCVSRFFTDLFRSN